MPLKLHMPVPSNDGTQICSKVLNLIFGNGHHAMAAMLKKCLCPLLRHSCSGCSEIWYMSGLHTVGISIYVLDFKRPNNFKQFYVYEKYRHGNISFLEVYAFLL